MNTKFLNTPTNLLGLLNEFRNVCASIKLDDIDRLFARFGISNRNCDSEREKFLKEKFGARRARFTMYIEDLNLNSNASPHLVVNELSAPFMRIIDTLEMDTAEKEAIKANLTAELLAIRSGNEHFLKIKAFSNNQAFVLENERVCRTYDVGDYLAAIGAVKSLVESACKIFLSSMGFSLDANPNYKKLIYESQNALGLHPDQHNSGAAIKSFVGSFRTPIEQIGEIRNQTSGTGAHGAALIDVHIDETLFIAIHQTARSWCELLEFKLKNSALDHFNVAS